MSNQKLVWFTKTYPASKRNLPGCKKTHFGTLVCPNRGIFANGPCHSMTPGGVESQQRLKGKRVYDQTRQIVCMWRLL